MIYFNAIALTFFAIAGIFIVYMVIYLIVANARRRTYKKWKNRADAMVSEVIFSEVATDTEEVIPLNNHTQILLQNKRFRKLINKEILLAKKNMSGVAAIFLQKFYYQLGLQEDVLHQLASKKWHIKAKAIQDIGIMELREYLTKVYRQTNHKNELVRMEAQLAVIRLTGFSGLRFLDVVSYQINDWQQIKLLNELSHLSSDNFTEIEKWIASSNDSVVVFALKLVKNFHRFELYEQVLTCLQQPNEKIRKHAYLALEKIYTDTTSKVLLTYYDTETADNKAVMIQVIQEIGDETDIAILLSLVETASVEQQRTLVRAIAHLSSNGIPTLRMLPAGHHAPLKLIIDQIEEEISA